MFNTANVISSGNGHIAGRSFVMVHTGNSGPIRALPIPGPFRMDKIPFPHVNSLDILNILDGYGIPIFNFDTIGLYQRYYQYP